MIFPLTKLFLFKRSIVSKGLTEELINDNVRCFTGGESTKDLHIFTKSQYFFMFLGVNLVRDQFFVSVLMVFAGAT